MILIPVVPLHVLCSLWPGRQDIQSWHVASVCRLETGEQAVQHRPLEHRQQAVQHCTEPESEAGSACAAGDEKILPRHYKNKKMAAMHRRMTTSEHHQLTSAYSSAKMNICLQRVYNEEADTGERTYRKSRCTLQTAFPFLLEVNMASADSLKRSFA